MTPEIRVMTTGDLEAVLAIAQRSDGAPHWPPRAYSSAIQKRRTAALVAMAANKLAGFAIATLVLDICQFESIVVAAEFRRQGIGAALLQDVIASSRQRGATRIELEVRAGNSAAIALYERAGFLRDGLRRRYYRDPQEDAVLMSLALDLPSPAVEKNP
jgi:ribosomal-protein-alanine N-acetyltransferase